MTGKDLKKKLELTGIPLRQIADALDISEQNLQNKMASADIKVSFLCKISKALHKSIYFLLDGQDFYKETSDEFKSHGTEKVQSMPSDAVALRLMEKLDEKDAKIDQLQSELRSMEKELAVLKAQHPETSIPHPEVLNPAKNASTKKPSSSPNAGNVTSATAHSE